MKTVILKPGTHCLVPVHKSIIEQVRTLKHEAPIESLDDGFNRGIDAAVEILEKVRAINPTESDSSTVNTDQLLTIAQECSSGWDESDPDDNEFVWDGTKADLKRFAARIRAEALQDAAAYVLANAKIKNSCCAETRASIYTLIKGMGND